MVRVPLEELALQIHLLRLGKAGSFLARVLQPPPEKSVAGAVRTLQEVGALTAAEELTPLGEACASVLVSVCLFVCLCMCVCVVEGVLAGLVRQLPHSAVDT